MSNSTPKNRVPSESPKLALERREGKSMGTMIRAMPSVPWGGIEKVKSVEKEVGFGERNLKGDRRKRSPEVRGDFFGPVRLTNEPALVNLASPITSRSGSKCGAVKKGFEVTDWGNGWRRRARAKIIRHCIVRERRRERSDCLWVRVCTL